MIEDLEAIITKTRRVSSRVYTVLTLDFLLYSIIYLLLKLLLLIYFRSNLKVTLKKIV